MITFTTNDWPVVSAPEGLTSVVDGTSVTLSWQPVADVVSYEVRYRKGSSTQSIVARAKKLKELGAKTSKNLD